MSDGSGSGLSDAAWRGFFAELEETYPDYFGRILVSRQGDRAVVSGEVPSVDAKIRIVARLRQIPGIRDVIDLLIVAAPFWPAHPWDPLSGDLPPETSREKAFETKAALQYDEGTRIVRHPSIRPQGEAVAGQRLRIMIDLALQSDPETNGRAITLSDLDEDWEEVPIRVRLVSAHMTFEKGANIGSVLVRRNQPSLAAYVEGTVEDDVDLDMIHVRALFDGKGGHYGDAERVIDIVRKQADLDTEKQNVATIVIEESRRPPDMTLRILSLRAKDVYDWEALSYYSFGPADRSGEITIDETASQYTAQLRTQVVQLQPGQHQAAFKGIGEEVWNLTPSGFKEVYWAFRQRLGGNFSIQLVTDEPYIQWELMKPFNSATNEEADHLMIDHPIARWVRKSDGNLSQQLPRGAIATFAPTYQNNPQYRLPFAASESAGLCKEFGAIPCIADRSSFLQIMVNGLPNEKVGILHFAGHGSFDGPGENGIMMDDGWIMRIEVDHRGTMLGQKDGTFVVLNACDVGNVAYTLGMVEGWASVFTRRKFGGFIAPLWRVADRHASEFVQRFVKGLHRDNLELGEAMRRSREALADSSPTAFAYVCYGDVLARVV